MQAAEQHGASSSQASGQVETTIEDGPSTYVDDWGGVGLQDTAESSAAQPQFSLNGKSKDNSDGLYNQVPDSENPRYPEPRPANVWPHAEKDGAGFETPTVSPAKPKPVAWSDLPNKKQLAILFMARLSEPLTQTSLQAYMFYQLRSFNPSLPDSTISAQAGLLQGSFTAAQFTTAMLWGRMADSEKVGRKRVLLIGLLGTCVSCVGFGFSRSFIQAALFRIMGGALNGNVGVMRTMISEIVREKKFQSRAFLLLPMCFNIGVIIGPVLGGFLSEPVTSYPRIFGEHSLFGGKNGVWWLEHWPYALPNLLSAIFLFTAAALVISGLEETLEPLRDNPDFGLHFGRSMANFFCRMFHFRTYDYTAINQNDSLDSPASSSRLDSYELESRLSSPSSSPFTTKAKSKSKARLAFSRIWTRNVICVLSCHAFLAFHVGTFNNLWFVHLSTPRFDPSQPSPSSHKHQTLPFSFTGGLGMPPRSVGFAMAVRGVIGISLQLLIFPRVNAALGTTRSFRYSLCLFPLAYTVTPYLSIIPSTTAPPAQATGILIWLSIIFVLLVQVLARTFALPDAIILINNCSPHPSVLGTIHGIAQSVDSASRTLGPVIGGWAFGKGLQIGVVGLIWWSLAVVAVCGCGMSTLVREGDGHEIWLEGEKEETEGMEKGGGAEVEGELGARRQGRPGYVRESTQRAMR